MEHPGPLLSPSSKNIKTIKIKKIYSEKISYIFSKKIFSYISRKWNSYISGNGFLKIKKIRRKLSELKKIQSEIISYVSRNENFWLQA